MIRLQLRDQPERFIGMTAGSFTIGRDVSNDFVIDDPSVSDFHAEVISDPDGCGIADLLSATGTFVNEHRVRERHPLSAWDIVRVGSVELEVNDPTVHRPSDWALRAQSDLLASQHLPLKATTVVGRGGDCDLTIDDVSLSRRHAQISIEGGMLRVRDLGSANGTFANGNRIREGVLRQGDELRFGSRAFVVVAPADPGAGARADDATQVQGPAADCDPNDADTEWLYDQSQPAMLVEVSEIIGAGEPLRVRQRSCRLGRGADNDIVIPDASVSRDHAVLTLRGDSWQIDDLESSNGMLINGQRAETALLNDGDLITLGRAEFRFHRDHG